MVTFLERCKPPEFTQEEINNMIILVFIKEIGFVVKKLFPDKIPGLGSFAGEVY